MMTLEAMLAAWRAHSKAEAVAHEAAVAMRDRYAQAICPFKVGDVVPNCGYSYTGKPMRIDAIFGRDRGDGIEWAVHGRLFTAKGQQMKRHRHDGAFNQSQWEGRGRPTKVTA